MSVGGVCALIGEAFYLAGGEGAVLVQPCYDMEAYGMAYPVGYEGLLAGAVNADAAPAYLSAAPCAQGLVEGVLLVAEAAAYVGLYYPYIRPGAAQRLSHNTADYMGYLGGSDHGKPAVLLVCKAAVVLYVAVLYGGRLIPALDLDKAGLLYSLGVVALLNGGVLEYVIRAAIVELWGAVLHGLLNVKHEGQLLVFHLQGADALIGGDLILGYNHGNVVAVVAHVAVKQKPVLYVLMPRVHAPGMAGGGKGYIRHVEAGEHLYDAGYFLRTGGIYILYEAVGDGGVLYAHIQRVARHTVLVVFGAAGHLVEGVHAHFTPADQVLGLNGIIILIHDLSSLSLFITCPPYH